MARKPSIALLIDGDQVAPETLPPLLDRLGKTWIVDERICIRNWRSTKDLDAWRTFAAEHGFRLFQRDPVTAAKNAADIELAVVAIDMLRDGREAFCLVSGDTDFTPVIERIKRGGCHIEVVQPKQLQGAKPARRGGRTARPARAAPASKPAAQSGRSAAGTAPAKQAPARRSRGRAARKPEQDTSTQEKPATEEQRRFAKHIRRAVDQLKKSGHHDGGWVSVNRIGSMLSRDGIRREEHGFAKSRPLHQVLDDLGFRVEQIETGAYQASIPASAS